MRVVVGIPARMGSSRLPGKPLKKILDIPMIEHVYKRCLLSKYTSSVFVATCDNEIKEVVESFGGRAIMTDEDIPRPGLRVYDAAKQFDLEEDDIVVVVQGDEPLVHPDMIDLAISPLIDENDIYVSNLYLNIEGDDDLKDPNEIKVVTDLNFNALYMSRSQIPSTDHEEEPCLKMKQVCIMPFRWHFMKKFNELTPTPLEKSESIEMIRAIQHGFKVRMVKSPFLSKSVDTLNDLLEVEKIMRDDPIWSNYKNGE